MESKKARQRVALALDTCGMKGRFTVRDVAETAFREIKWNDLSVADQHDALMKFLMSEAKSQMKAPLRQDFKEEFFKKMPEKAWPVIEKLTKTICVGAGGQAAYHVFTFYATDDDWASYLDAAAVADQRVKSAKNAGRNIRLLLQQNGVSTLWELFTGQKARSLAIPDKRVA